MCREFPSAFLGLVSPEEEKSWAEDAEKEDDTSLDDCVELSTFESLDDKNVFVAYKTPLVTQRWHVGTACTANESISTDAPTVSSSSSSPAPLILSWSDLEEEAEDDDVLSDSDEGATYSKRQWLRAQRREEYSEAHTEYSAWAVDDYDIAWAIADFAAKRAGSAEEQRRGDLRQALHVARRQAKALRAAIRNPHQEAAHRQHYEAVHAELLREASAFEATLIACDSAVEVRNVRTKRVLVATTASDWQIHPLHSVTPTPCKRPRLQGEGGLERYSLMVC
eukprot:TRINITY_DN41540_c0_g1_i1.p1 TRINITY_DN41540_c0_g1~~TRINITY_DN41540_c0_g1_i1.p1  ORF type:complete len:280 (-),score=35.27 TRINITY_DN41540_c0_g1_i1:169-1008(-)